MAAHPSQMPQPGESFVTPQAWRVATRGDIEAFFDTATYQSKPVNTSVKPPKQVPMDELRALEREADAAVLARVEEDSLGGGGATMEHPSKAPATMEHPSKAPATITMEPLSKAPATMEHPSTAPATMEHPSKAPSLVDLVPPVPKSTVPPNPNKPVLEPTPPVTGNLANALAGGDDKLTPSQLWSQEIEDDVAKMLAKVDGEDLKNMVESARGHPEMKSNVEGVRLEIGNDGVWEFGEEDVYEDMLGFAVWVRARASMRKALGLDSPPTPGSNTSAEPETPAPPGPAEPTAPVHPPAAEPKAEPNTAPAVPKQRSPKHPILLHTRQSTSSP